MSISHLFKNAPLQLKAILRIVGEEEPIFGPGRLQLLENIEKTGSINQAAKNMGMSYKKAWQMISSMNTQAEKPLITTQTGGNSGGGAVVTDEGHEVMRYYQGLQKRFQAFLEEESKNLHV
ncbi:MAG: winged helix-turn-helix domain-containing protein [Saprospiraceae bacterium]|nr:winged helix-turn-helix domain-containing protein [Saprospiraceae bacterium]